MKHYEVMHLGRCSETKEDTLDGEEAEPDCPHIN